MGGGGSVGGGRAGEEGEVLGEDKKNAGCIRERKGGLGCIQKGRVSPNGQDRWASIALWDPRHAGLPKGGYLSSPSEGQLCWTGLCACPRNHVALGRKELLPDAFVDFPFSVQLLPLSQPLLGCLSVSFPPLCQGLYKTLPSTLY